MMVRLWSSRNSFIAGGMQGDTVTLEASLVVSSKLDILLPYSPATALLGIYPKELKTYVHTKPARGYLQQLYS